LTGGCDEMKEENELIEEMNEIFRKHGIGLKELCLWFVHTYPEDIFVNEPKEVVEIRENCKKLLKRMGV
jgi:hypothetical protein